jgi:hypothetical protein
MDRMQAFDPNQRARCEPLYDVDHGRAPASRFSTGLRAGRVVRLRWRGLVLVGLPAWEPAGWPSEWAVRDGLQRHIATR